LFRRKMSEGVWADRSRRPGSKRKNTSELAGRGSKEEGKNKDFAPKGKI